jgi:hypothetical protein
MFLRLMAPLQLLSFIVIDIPALEEESFHSSCTGYRNNFIVIR